MAQQIGVPLQHSGSMSGLESRNKQAGGGGGGLCLWSYGMQEQIQAEL